MTNHTICTNHVHKLINVAVQVVKDRLFTGSHDGTIKVWDLSGIKEKETKENGEDSEEETLEDYDFALDGEMEDYPGESGSMFLDNDTTAKRKSNKDEIMDMV